MELLAAWYPELGDRPVLLAFHSPGCPVCTRMTPRIEQLRRDCVGKKVGIVSLDVTESEGEALARAYGVAGVPTVLLLDAQRSVDGMLVGDHPLSELRAAAASLVKTSCGAEQPGLPDGQAASATCGASAPIDRAVPTCPG
jgi:thioredoxin-like negative regulator of GroEL